MDVLHACEDVLGANNISEPTCDSASLSKSNSESELDKDTDVGLSQSICISTPNIESSTISPTLLRLTRGIPNSLSVV